MRISSSPTDRILHIYLPKYPRPRLARTRPILIMCNKITLCDNSEKAFKKVTSKVDNNGLIYEHSTRQWSSGDHRTQTICGKCSTATLKLLTTIAADGFGAVKYLVSCIFARKPLGCLRIGRFLFKLHFPGSFSALGKLLSLLLLFEVGELLNCC